MEICSICHENLEWKPIQLPECGHNFIQIV